MRAPFQILVIPFRRTAGGPEFAVLRRSDADYWQFVAGGGEDDETPAQAAQRETKEEVGIVGNLTPLDSLATVPKSCFAAADSWGDDVFVIPEHCFGIDAGTREIALSSEHTESRWVPFGEASSLLKWDSNRNALWELNERLKASNRRLEDTARNVLRAGADSRPHRHNQAPEQTVGCTNMENYCNNIWPLIYDRYNQGRHEQELRFYSQELASCTGPVLEVACGTGMILLPLIKQGIDIYGFDLSEQMLHQLFTKAKSQNLPDVQRRVTQQNMIDFRIDAEFESIFIPARSFLHLATQEDQLACLRNIHRHLRDDGTFMLNIFTPSLSALVSRADPNPAFTDFGQFPHPDGESVINVSTRQTNDLSEQVQHITWRFEFDGHAQESGMLVRWIYKKEFELLAKLSGFAVAKLYSGFDKSPYNGEGEMVWVLEKAPNEPDGRDGQ